jgi:hypothetical protein
MRRFSPIRSNRGDLYTLYTVLSSSQEGRTRALLKMGYSDPSRPLDHRRPFWHCPLLLWRVFSETIICSSSSTDGPYGTPPGTIPRGRPCS